MPGVDFANWCFNDLALVTHLVVACMQNVWIAVL
jgi:hypothetical protein